MYEPKVIAVTAGIVIVVAIVVALGAILVGIVVKWICDEVCKHF